MLPCHWAATIIPLCPACPGSHAPLVWSQILEVELNRRRMRRSLTSSMPPLDSGDNKGSETTRSPLYKQIDHNLRVKKGKERDFFRKKKKSNIIICRNHCHNTEKQPVYSCSMSLVCFTLSWAHSTFFSHILSEEKHKGGRSYEARKKKVLVANACKSVLQI